MTDNIIIVHETLRESVVKDIVSLATLTCMAIAGKLIGSEALTYFGIGVWAIFAASSFKKHKDGSSLTIDAAIEKLHQMKGGKT